MIGDMEIVGEDDEYVGDELIGGDEDEIGDAELIGAIKRVGAAKVIRSIRKKGATRVPSGRGKGMRSPRGYLWRRQTMGINSTVTVPEATNADVTSFPQRDFKVKRLSVTSLITGSFDIRDAKVGQQSQNVGVGVMPAQCFAENAVSTYVDWDTAHEGNQIVTTVTNTDAVNAHFFKGLLIGLTAVPQYA